jgi:Tol biopolymer transport system component
MLLIALVLMTTVPACGTLTPPGPDTLQTIVFINDGNIWQIAGKDPPKQLTTGGNANHVRISSDGQKVAFTTFDSATLSAELRVVDSDGGGETVLLSQAQLDSLYPPDAAIHHAPYDLAFIPGTQILLFTTMDVLEAPGLFLHEDVVQVDAENGAFSILLDPGDGGTFAISPDGRKLAISRPASISLANVDGSDLLPDVLTYPEVPTDSELIYRAAPVWAPDSNELGVAIPSPIPFGPGVSGTIWRIPSDGETPTELATIEGKFFSLTSTAPFLSSDLLKVAFFHETTSFNVFDLYIANSDGTEGTLYATDVTSWQGWAPDNQHFVYTTGAMDLQLGLVGTPPVALGAGRDLRWMSDNSFLYLSGVVESWALMQGQLGSDRTPLVELAGDVIWIDYDFTP